MMTFLHGWRRKVGLVTLALALVFAAVSQILERRGKELSDSIRSRLKVIGELPADRSTLHPWFSDLLEKDAAGVAKAIQERMTADASNETRPLVEYIEEFVPHRLFYFDDSGFVQLLHRSAIGKTRFGSCDFLVVAQPLPDDDIEKSLSFFDPQFRPMMREFMSKFSNLAESILQIGDGEHLMGHFVLHEDLSAKDVCYPENSDLGRWAESRALYHARNGDFVLVDDHGSTAWHVFETLEVVPLFEDFAQFIRHWVDLHRIGPIDSWSSRKLLGIIKE